MEPLCSELSLMPTGVTIKAFGHISTLLGAAEVVVPCDSGLAVRSIVAHLEDKYPLFSKYMSHADDFEEYLLVVRDGRIEQPDSMIHPGEVLTLVTPISGG